MSAAANALDVALLVAAALEAAGIPYFLGGSLASSIHGEPRATNDIDFVVDLGPWQVRRLADALGPDFAVDEIALADAVRRGGTANVFYLPLVTKIDLFVRGNAPFDEAEFARSRPTRVRPDGATLRVKSPEDTVLRKLLWFVAGGNVSERQWRDIVAVLRIGQSTLDWIYLSTWANRLGLTELLARARTESAEPAST